MTYTVSSGTLNSTIPYHTSHHALPCVTSRMLLTLTSKACHNIVFTDRSTDIFYKFYCVLCFVWATLFHFENLIYSPLIVCGKFDDVLCIFTDKIYITEVMLTSCRFDNCKLLFCVQLITGAHSLIAHSVLPMLTILFCSRPTLASQNTHLRHFASWCGI